MRNPSCWLVALLVLYLAQPPVFAQTGSTAAALSGIVEDSSGVVVQGVRVVIKSAETGVALAPLVTNDRGLFTAPSLAPGNYEVTFSLPGFKTLMMDDVRLTTATPADLRVKLEVGSITETVEVIADAGVVQRQSTAISSTLYSEQIKNLPLQTRDVLNFIGLLPGVDVGGNHVQRRQTQIGGLPFTHVLIAVDGIQTRSTAGSNPPEIFSYISPSLDAMAEATISIATPGADASGQGAAQIRFTTRSGGEHYQGSFYETFRHPALSTKTFFDKVNGLPKNSTVLNQFGGNVGGPLLLPGVLAAGKAFFFTNYEELRQDAEIGRNRTLIGAAAQSGVFSYTTGSGVRQVNVLDVAASNGQIASVDPTIRNLLAQISSAATLQGTVTPNSDANTNAYVWNSPDNLVRKFSNSRFDFNLTPAHRLSVVVAINTYSRSPDTFTSRDPRFPGLPNFGVNYSTRHSLSANLRSVLAPNLVNEFTGGRFWLDGNVGYNISEAQFENQGGYSLRLAGTGVFSAVTSGTAGNNASDANGAGNHSSPGWGSLWSFADKLSWQRGRHLLQFGGEAAFIHSRDQDRQIVPAINFGLDTANDPANAMFTTANFPGASTNNLNDARSLYALLTGRVSQISTELSLDPELGQYVADGFSDRQGHLHEVGFFAQDAFRLNRHLTLNAGLRYELQLPFRADNSVWSANTVADACGISGIGSGPGGRPCNFFKPGTLTGQTPVYERYEEGTNRYVTDRNNLAPSIGVAWLPGVETGLLRAILGDPN